MTQSLREALEGFSWSRLAEYLLPKRDIIVRLISLSSEPVWHPVVLKKSCLIIKPLELLHRFSQVGIFRGRLSKNNGVPCVFFYFFQLMIFRWLRLHYAYFNIYVVK